MITGSCYCGAIRFEISAPLSKARSCHRSRCRKAFGGAASAYAEIQPGSFRYQAGEERLKPYLIDADSGLGFCDTCGSLLVGLHRGEVHGVTLGSLDGDPGVELEMHLYVGSKAPWDHIGGEAPRYEEMPPGM